MMSFYLFILCTLLDLEKFINKLDQRATRKARKSPVNKRRRIIGGTVHHLIPQAAQQWMIKPPATPVG